MQGKTISNRNSSLSNKPINNYNQTDQSIKKHSNKTNGNGNHLNNSNNHNYRNQHNHQSNQPHQNNNHLNQQPGNVILLHNQPLPPHQFIGTPMISPYINLATTRLPPYLNLAYPANGLNNSHQHNSQSHYISNNQPQQSNRHYQSNKNGNVYQARMPNSSPPPVNSTASGSSSQGSSTSGIGCSSTSSNCASNNYHLNNTNSNGNGVSSQPTQQQQQQSSTQHTPVINNNSLNSLSNGKLNNNTNSSANTNSSTSSSCSTNNNGNNNLVKNASNGNLIMSNNNGTSNNSVVSQQQQQQTNNNSTTTTNGNLNNNNNQNGSTNNESTNGTYGEQLSRTNLYIRGLSPTTTDKNLYELCSPFGKIVSTKAIIDKTTNNCKGYGFVDFDSPVAAENAVKQLQVQGIEAQMAKRTDWGKKASNNSNSLENNDNNYNSSSDYNLNNSHNNHNNKSSQQEQDPTNLYIANLPTTMTETDLDLMLNPFGNVISTRILKDMNLQPRGVGFARMESKEKCDLIIQNFNNKLLVGSKEPLLVKFADGGNKKKNQYKNSQTGDSRMSQNTVGGWREPNGSISNNGNAADQLSPYGYTSSNQQDHHSHHPNPMVVAAHHAVANSGHQATVATVHHNGLPTQLISNISNLPISASIAAYHPHHPNNPHARNHPSYSSAQPLSANYPLNATAPWMHHPGTAAHYQLLPGAAHLQNSQQLAMDPNAALHFMPAMAAQMQQLQIGGHSYIAGNPGIPTNAAYGNASQGHIYTTQAGTPLMQPMSLSENTDNPNSTNSSVGPSDSNEINQQSYNAVYSK